MIYFILHDLEFLTFVVVILAYIKGGCFYDLFHFTWSRVFDFCRCYSCISCSRFCFHTFPSIFIRFPCILFRPLRSAKTETSYFSFHFSIAKARKRASWWLDGLLVAARRQPRTPTPLFLNKKTARPCTHSYLLVCCLQRSTAGPAKHGAWLPPRRSAQVPTLRGHFGVPPPPPRCLCPPPRQACPLRAPRVRWPMPRSRCSPRGARAPHAGAHPGRGAGPRPEAHWRAPCVAAMSSSVIRPSNKVTLRAENACYKIMFQVFQMFHVDVAEVDRNVAYVAMIVHVYCKLLFPMFQLFF
jgi:hypothetical protein